MEIDDLLSISAEQLFNRVHPPNESDFFNSVLGWSAVLGMHLSYNLVKEIIFYNPRVLPNYTPPPIFGIEQVSSAKLLGVYIQENFSCDVHFKHIITVSSQRLHILKALRRQGLRQGREELCAKCFDFGWMTLFSKLQSSRLHSAIVQKAIAAGGAYDVIPPSL